jgi:4-hydroxyphenylpyruvate dioxygenase
MQCSSSTTKKDTFVLKADVRVMQQVYLNCAPVQGPFLAGYTPVNSPPLCYGIKRLDHAVGNVPKLKESLKYIADATGFHEFAEFTAEVRPSTT